MRLIRAKQNNANRGAALILVMLLAIVGTLMGLWGMTSSRESLLRIGTYRSALDVRYEAERALQLAVSRIKTIANSVDGSDDPVNETDGKNLTFLVNGQPGCGICQPSVCPGDTDVACPSETELTDSTLDQIETDSGGSRTNVICNFMGDSFENTRVALVRKADHIDTYTSAIFLLNVTSMNKTGKRQVLQGVVVVPYEVGPVQAGTCTSYVVPEGTKVHLATVNKT